MAKKDERVLLRNAGTGAGVYLNRDQVEQFRKDHPGYAEESEAKAVKSNETEDKAVRSPAKKRG